MVITQKRSDQHERRARRVRALVVTVAMAAAFSAAKAEEAATSAAAGMLDGRRYAGPIGQKGMESDHGDVLVFENGTFLSEGCSKWGFEAAPYTVTTEENVPIFRAETTSRTHGAMVWEGRIKGDSLEGTMVWTKKRLFWTMRNEYWFRTVLRIRDGS